jgi:hypothetical protein
MLSSSWTPSIVPNEVNHAVYLVLDDFGRRGRAWREADVEATDLETVILDLLQGQYKNPIRVVGFNTAEKWSQDVSADVAHELRKRCDLQLRDVPFFIQDFVDRYEGRYHDIQLRCQCGWFEHGLPAATIGSDWRQDTVPRFRCSCTGNVDR